MLAGLPPAADRRVAPSGWLSHGQDPPGRRSRGRSQDLLIILLNIGLHCDQSSPRTNTFLHTTILRKYLRIKEELNFFQNSPLFFSLLLGVFLVGRFLARMAGYQTYQEEVCLPSANSLCQSSETGTRLDKELPLTAAVLRAPLLGIRQHMF